MVYTSGSGVHGAGGSRCRRDGVNGIGDVAQTLLERSLGVAAAFRTPPALPGGDARASEPSSALIDRWVVEWIRLLTLGQPPLIYKHCRPRPEPNGHRFASR